jgi:glycosyltransferase involved in cell wall biosynthesis
MSLLFSIVIPAHNAIATLPACLDSVTKMEKPSGGYEIIVVNDGSTDETPICAARFGATVISKRFDCVAAVRNAGAAIASGTILAFLDADVVVDVRWLRHAEEHYFSRGWSGVLSYADRAPIDAGWIGTAWNDPLRRSAFHGSAPQFMPTRNLFVPRELHEAIGGFDENLFAGHRTGEDKDYTWRLKQMNVPLFCDQSLDMVHLGRERTLKELLRKERWRQGAALLMAAHHHWNLRLLRTPVIAAIHAGALLVIVIGIILWVLIGKPGAVVTIAGIAMWPLFSLLQTLRDSAGHLPVHKFFPVWLILCLRWTVAATALPGQVAILIRRKLKTG